MNISQEDKQMIGEYGEFSNLCGFLGHEGRVAMCPTCGVILHKNLIQIYPYKTCFNCGDHFVVYPYFLAEGIWNYNKKGFLVDSFVFNDEINYAEIKFTKAINPKEHLPRNWKMKEELFPYTDYDYVKNTIVLFVQKKHENDDSFDWFMDGLFSFSGWLND